MNNDNSIIYSLFGAILGGILSFFATWLFYRKSSNELKAESKKLRRLTEVLLSYISDKEKVNVKNIIAQNENGEWCNNKEIKVFDTGKGYDEIIKK